jgi:hypothetical protein
MRRRIGVLVAVTALVLAACSGDDSSVATGGPLTQPATEDGLRAAVTKAGEGVLAKDAAGTYALLSARCQGLLTQAEWASQLIVGIGLLEAF